MSVRASLPEAKKYRDLLESLVAADGAAAARAVSASSAVDAGTMTNNNNGRERASMNASSLMSATDTIVRNAASGTAANGAQQRTGGATEASRALAAAADEENIAIRKEEKSAQLILRDILHPEKKTINERKRAGSTSAFAGSAGVFTLNTSSVSGGADDLVVGGFGAAAMASSAGISRRTLAALNSSAPPTTGMLSSTSATSTPPPPSLAGLSAREQHEEQQRMERERRYNNRPDSAGPHPLAGTASAMPPHQGLSIYNRDARGNSITYTATMTRPNTVHGGGVVGSGRMGMGGGSKGLLSTPSTSPFFANTRTLRGRPIASLEGNANISQHMTSPGKGIGGGSPLFTTHSSSSPQQKKGAPAPRNLPALDTTTYNSTPFDAGISADSILNRQGPRKEKQYHQVYASDHFSRQQQAEGEGEGAHPHPSSFASSPSHFPPAAAVSTLKDLLNDQRAALSTEAEAFEQHAAMREAYLASMRPHTECPKATNMLQRRRIEEEEARQKEAARLERRRKRRIAKKKARLAEEAARKQEEEALQQQHEEEKGNAANETSDVNSDVMGPQQDTVTTVFDHHEPKEAEDKKAHEKGNAEGRTLTAPTASTAITTSSGAEKPLSTTNTTTVRYTAAFLRDKVPPPSLTEQFFGERVRRYRIERSGGVCGEEPYRLYDDRAVKEDCSNGSEGRRAVMESTPHFAESDRDNGGGGNKITKGGDAADDEASKLRLALKAPEKVNLKELMGIKVESQLVKSGVIVEDVDEDAFDDADLEDVSSSEDEEDRRDREARAAAEMEAAKALAAAKEAERIARLMEMNRLIPRDLISQHVSEEQQQNPLKLRHFGVQESEGFVTTIFGYSPTRQRLPAHSPTTAAAAAKSAVANVSAAGSQPVVAGGVAHDVVPRANASSFSVTLKHKNVLEAPTQAPSVTAAYMPMVRQPKKDMDEAFAARVPAIYSPPTTLATVILSSASADAAAAAQIDSAMHDPSDIDGPFQRLNVSADLASAFKSTRHRADKKMANGTVKRGGVAAKEENEGDASKKEEKEVEEVGAKEANASASQLEPVDVSAIAPVFEAAPAAGSKKTSAAEGLLSSSDAPLLVARPSSTIDGQPRPTTSDDPFKVIDIVPPLDGEEDMFPIPPRGQRGGGGANEDDDGDDFDDITSRPATATDLTTMTTMMATAVTTALAACADGNSMAISSAADSIAVVGGVAGGGGGGADPTRPILEQDPNGGKPRQVLPSLEQLHLEVEKHTLEDELTHVQAVEQSLLQSREALLALRLQSREKAHLAVAELKDVEDEIQKQIIKDAPAYSAQRRKVEAEEKKNDPRRTFHPKQGTASQVWEGRHSGLGEDVERSQQLIIDYDAAASREATREGYYKMRTEALRRLEDLIEPSARGAIANFESSAFSVLAAICTDVFVAETRQRREIVREQKDHFRSAVSAAAADRHRAECAVWMPSLLEPYERFDQHLLPPNPLRPATVATITTTTTAGNVSSISNTSARVSPPIRVGTLNAGARKETESTTASSGGVAHDAATVETARPHTAITSYEEEHSKRRREHFEKAAEEYRQRLRQGWDEEQADREHLLRLQRDKLRYKQEKRTFKRLFFEACAAAELLPSEVEMGGENGATASIRPASTTSPSSPPAAGNHSENNLQTADAKSSADVNHSSNFWRAPPTPLSPARPATAVTDTDDVVMQWTTAVSSNKATQASPPANTTNTSNTSGRLLPNDDRAMDAHHHSSDNAVTDPRAVTPATPQRGHKLKGVDDEMPTTPRRQEVLRLRQRLEYVQWALEDVEQREEALKKKIFAKVAPKTTNTTNTSAAAVAAADTSAKRDA